MEQVTITLTRDDTDSLKKARFRGAANGFDVTAYSEDKAGAPDTIQALLGDE